MATAPCPSTRPSLSLGRRLFFGLAVLLVLAGLQEVGMRYLFPLPAIPSFNRTHYMGMNLSGEEEVRARAAGLHNVAVTWQSEPDGFAYTHHLNLYGFRGPTFPLRKTPGRPRVLFVGDSFVEGCGAGDEETIPVQFARALEGRVEAINMGVAGVGMPEYVLLVRDGMTVLNPDAVFLCICSNDLPTCPFPPTYRAPAPPFPSRRNATPRLAAVVSRLRKGQPVPRVLHAGPTPFFAAVPAPSNPLTWAEAGPQVQPPNFIWKVKPPPANIDPGILDCMRRGTFNPWTCRALEWEEAFIRYDFTQGGGSQDFLAHLAGLCRERGIPLHVMYMPYHGALTPEYRAAQERLGSEKLASIPPLDDPRHHSHQIHLASVTASLGIPFLDLTDEMIRAERVGVRTFWALDGHCTPAGYQLAAHQCARLWRERTGEVREQKPAQGQATINGKGKTG